MAERYIPETGTILLEGTEEERQAALEESLEAWAKSEQKYQRYLEAFDGWQDKGCPIDKKSAVETMWLEYTENYNDYLGVHRNSAGKYGYHHKAPRVQQHA